MMNGQSSESPIVAALLGRIKDLEYFVFILAESFIMTQEFMENELGDMSFRESTTHADLMRLFNEHWQKKNDAVRVESNFPLDLSRSAVTNEVAPSSSANDIGANNLGMTISPPGMNQQFFLSGLALINGMRMEGDDKMMQGNVRNYNEISPKSNLQIDETYATDSANVPPPPPMKRGRFTEPSLSPLEGKKKSVRRQLLSMPPPPLQRIPKTATTPLSTASSSFNNTNGVQSVFQPSPGFTSECKMAVFTTPPQSNESAVGENLATNSKTVVNCSATKRRRSLKQKQSLQTKSKTSKEVNCPFCLKLYSSQGVMHRHVKENHSQEPQFLCPYCKLRFRTGPKRLHHMKSLHATELSAVECTYCSRIATSPVGLRNHMISCSKKPATVTK